MRFKYYLKGLGMGIIITTIVMSISCVMHNNNLSDEEIIEKAIELGMVMPDSEKESESGLFGNHDKESSESGDSESEGEPQSGSEVTSEPSEVETESELPTEIELPTETEIPTETETETPTETEEPATQQPPQHVEVQQYVLHIVWGDYPRKIANELYENGMIDNAKTFRNYLGDYCKQHNKEIRVGTYTITKGMTYEEIAKIITKS